MSMGMIHLEQAGMGATPLTSFNDPITANTTAAAEAARAVGVAEQAKASTNPEVIRRLNAEANAILANARLLAGKESQAVVVQSKALPLVTVGEGAGKILGMDSKTFMLVAAAAVVMVMSEKH